jgi:arabinose-5-phosphate isomerase
MPDTLALVQDVLRSEGGAVLRLAETLGSQQAVVETVCAVIRSRCGDGVAGRLVVTGVGKAGHIGHKLAATFASTGTPAFFLHPAEARHGDLGMVQAADVVLAISNSGSSEEIIALVPSVRLIGCTLIALVGPATSPLARLADHVLAIGAVVEACPLGLAPSTSTTTLLALGDALALTIQRQRAFTPEQYARYHPGGALGRKLMTCSEAMRAGERVAAVSAETTVLAALQAITAARAGSVLLIDADQRLRGIFTDGDLRRALMRSVDASQVLTAPVARFATMPCRHVRGSELLQSALHLCSERKINELPVVDDDGRLVGLLDLQDLVDRGFEIGR